MDLMEYDFVVGEEKEKSYVEMAALFERLIYEKYDNPLSSPSAVRVASSTTVLIQLVRILQKRSPIMNVLLQEILKSVYSGDITSFKKNNEENHATDDANGEYDAGEYNIPVLFQELASNDTYISKFEVLTEDNDEIQNALTVLMEQNEKNTAGIPEDKPNIKLLLEKLQLIRKSFGDRYQRFLKKSCFFGWLRYTQQGIFNKNVLHKRSMDRWWKRWLEAFYQQQKPPQRRKKKTLFTDTADSGDSKKLSVDSIEPAESADSTARPVIPSRRVSYGSSSIDESPVPSRSVSMDNKTTPFSRSFSISGGMTGGKFGNVANSVQRAMLQRSSSDLGDIDWGNEPPEERPKTASASSTAAQDAATTKKPFAMQRSATMVALLEKKMKRDGGVDKYIKHSHQSLTNKSNGPTPPRDVKLDNDLAARLMYFDGLCQRIEKQFEVLVHAKPPATPTEPPRRKYGRVIESEGPRLTRGLFAEQLRKQMTALILNLSKETLQEDVLRREEEQKAVDFLPNEISTQTDANDLLFA